MDTREKQTPAIDIRKLGKVFGAKKVLRGLDFQAKPGEFVVILGPNGAGKSTLLRILATLSRPTGGEVRVAGYKLPEMASAVRARLGVVTHQPMLYGNLTAEENLLFFGSMYNLTGARARIQLILETIGLASCRRDLVRTFSRGMQQRLAIGRAILHDPEVILFDEPYTGLDLEACDVLDRILLKVIDINRTVVLTSHDLSRVDSLATRFDVLNRGVIVASVLRNAMPGTLLDFYREALA